MTTPSSGPVMVRCLWPTGQFDVGDYSITMAGVEIPSREIADQLMEVAVLNGVKLEIYDVSTPEEPPVDPGNPVLGKQEEDETE